jgi:hypothetical protein
LLKPCQVPELFMDNNSEESEIDNVTAEDEGSYEEAATE